jgi:diguanylate cyclase (GGDEF)-like protein/PAS domain S-box-containing protein
LSYKGRIVFSTPFVLIAIGFVTYELSIPNYTQAFIHGLIGIIVIILGFSLGKQLDQSKFILNELENNRQVLQQIIDNVDATIFLLDLKKRKYHLSKGVENVFGVPVSAFKYSTESWLKLIHPDDQHIALRYKEKIFSGEQHSFEVRIITPERKTKWIRCHVKPLFDNKEKVKNINGVVVDITKNKNLEKELKDSEERHRSIFELSPTAILIHKNGKILYTNPATARIVGLNKAEDAIGRSISDFLHPDSVEAAYKEIGKIMEDKGSGYNEYKLLKTNGSVIIVSMRGKRILYQGEPAVLSIGEDITTLNQKERKLIESEERYRSVVEFSPNSIMIHRNGKILYVNPAAKKLGGYNDSDVLIGKSIIDFIHPDDREKLLTRISKLMNGDNIEPFVSRLLRKDKSIVFVEVIGIRIQFQEEEAILTIGKDVTNRKKAEEEIYRLAYYDILTGLPNRKKFTDLLLYEINKSEKENFTVMFLDLDGFKSVNDTFGHDAGDKLLIEASKRITSCLKQDDIASRFGGDEFTILLRNIGENDSQYVAQTIINHFQKPFIISEEEVNVTPSIGLSFYSRDGSDVNQLLKNADIALYRAKQKGKNNFVLFSDIT